MSTGRDSIDNLEYLYSDEHAKSQAYLLLHGVRGGIDEMYIQTLINKIVARGDTALAINFPYMTRGETTIKSAAFEEELDALQIAYDFLKSQHKARVHIIGKSAGAVILSHWLSQQNNIEDVDVSIMGYIGGEGGIVTDALRDKLKVVVQGEYDRYSTVAEVRAELRAHHVVAEVVEIPNADHSYRDTVSSNPPPYAYQAQAIDELLKRI